MVKGRNYFDDGKVDDTLDIIRVVDRQVAKQHFLDALGIARQEGVVLGVERCIKALRAEGDKPQS